MTTKKFFKEGQELNAVEQLMQDGKFMTPEFNEMTLEEIAKTAYTTKPTDKEEIEDVENLKLGDTGLLCLVFNSDIPIEDKLVFTVKVYQQVHSFNEKMVLSFLDKLWYAAEGIYGLCDDVVLTTECPYCESREIFDIFKDIKELKELLSEADFDKDELAFRVRIRTTRAYNQEIGSFDIYGNGEITDLYIESWDNDRFNFDGIICMANLFITNPYKIGDKVKLLEEDNNTVYTITEVEENEKLVSIRNDDNSFGLIRHIFNIEPAE